MVGQEAGQQADAAAFRQHPVIAALNIYPDQLDQLVQKIDKALEVAEGMA